MRRADETSRVSGRGRRTDQTDPRSVLAHLVRTVRFASVRLELEALKAHSDVAIERWSVVRSCERELALVADAVGHEGHARAHVSAHADPPLEVVTAAYERALRADLPRPVRQVLTHHLHRLHRLSTPRAA
ncbi:MAG: hypothetical protein HOW73_43050 [Polyangiaceae bacterium]|nr:hypothetical protein [Polyangiaceae bacterium]